MCDCKSTILRLYRHLVASSIRVSSPHASSFPKRLHLLHRGDAGRDWNQSISDRLPMSTTQPSARHHTLPYALQQCDDWCSTRNMYGSKLMPVKFGPIAKPTRLKMQCRPKCDHIDITTPPHHITSEPNHAPILFNAFMYSGMTSCGFSDDVVVAELKVESPGCTFRHDCEPSRPSSEPKRCCP